MGNMNRCRFARRMLVASLMLAAMVHDSSGQFVNELEPDIGQTDGPVIFPQKSEIILQQGQNFTLKCKGKTEVQFKQQEVPEDVVGLFRTHESKHSALDFEYNFEASLDLYDVDSFAVGYYACYDDMVNRSEVLTSIKHEMENTEHISYIYIYVNGSNNLFAPMRDEVHLAKSGSDVVIPCRPTTPDVTMTLTLDGIEIDILKKTPKVGFVLDSDDLLDNPLIFSCAFQRGGMFDDRDGIVHKMTIIPPPKPTVIGNSHFFLKGETIFLTCSVEYQANSAVELTWNIPGDNWDKATVVTNGQSVTKGKLYTNITIVNATAEDAGDYSCVSKNTASEIRTNYSKVYKDYGFIRIQKGIHSNPLETNQKVINMHFMVVDYPPASISCFKDDKQINFNGSSKYTLRRALNENVFIIIRNLTVTDSGNYTMVAVNNYSKGSVGYDLRVKARPTVSFGSENDKTYMKQSTATLVCDVMGYPLPNVKWIFKPFPEFNTAEEVFKSEETAVSSVYKLTSYIKIPAIMSGNVTCIASNALGTAAASRRFLVYEIPEGFGIRDSKTWFAEDEEVSLACMASVYYYNNVTWMKDNEELLDGSVKHLKSQLSRIATLNIERISLDQGGNYTCIGYRDDGDMSIDVVTLVVKARAAPIIEAPDSDQDLKVYPYQPVTLSCLAEGIPKPKIAWYKDGEVINSDDNVKITIEDISHTTVNSSLSITQMQETSTGRYECLAINNDQASKFFNVIVKEKYTFKSSYMAIIASIFIILLVLVLYLTWKIRKEKQFRKELAAAGLLYFKEGVTGSLNPELGIDEQAELLPYDEKFEFPSDKLKLGKQLGAGAFGVVYKADARGIIDAEETTTVAVKMVKKTADNMYIKALASELKIMVHLGKHVNIVNLLGACTKNVGKRELIVIVEYCKFGNIHNYLQKHREVFIDQLNDDSEKSFGRVNRGFSYSSANSGAHSEYFGGTNQTQETDNTFLNSNNTNRSRKGSEAGYVQVDWRGYLQPQWRSNYESDYSYDSRSLRPLCSRDLLCWAFQIARGMEYLASRKVLHGDLAARNILLAEDNVVKICDFGLARSIYKNDEYHKQENSLLPVKWLALECMTDRIFSTQSDVWSFGIVLWELFTLAKTPYPNVGPERLLHWLSEGNRLSKPEYSDERLYGLMQRCWAHRPAVRPAFGQLQEILGSFLEDNVRNHYIDLNSTNMELNKKKEGVEDYLAMVCAPDYSAAVTPSPHPYANDLGSFFPPAPTLQHDDEGYLQMSPAGAAAAAAAAAAGPRGARFDFDARKLNRSDSEPSHELTPMLTLNNLPARGSDSDPEPGASPYLNMCPRIDEEADEVFEASRSRAPNSVTNPTYLKFDVDRGYANVPAPALPMPAGGLVK